MECELGKYEPVWREQIIIVDGKEVKKNIRFLKLSMYLEVHEFPDVTAYDGAKMYLYREKPDEGKGSISPDMIERLLTPLEVVVEVLRSQKKEDAEIVKGE